MEKKIIIIKPIFLLSALGLIWGIGYSLARYVMIHGVSPLNYSFWQAIGPAVLLFLFVLVKRNKFNFTAPYLRYYLVTALLGIVIPNTNMYFIAPLLPAGILAIIVNTVPIITYPLALLAVEEKFNFFRLLGVCFGMIGITLVILPGTSLTTSKLSLDALYALITPLCFALCAIYASKRRPKDSDSITLSAGMLIVATILLTPLVFFYKKFQLVLPPLNLVDWIILLEIILTSIGYILIFELLKSYGAVCYSLVGGITVLTGLFWGYIIFHEQANAYIIFAVLFICTAIILVTLHPKNQEPASL